jgi:hypothetical protein
VYCHRDSEWKPHRTAVAAGTASRSSTAVSPRWHDRQFAGYKAELVISRTVVYDARASRLITDRYFCLRRRPDLRDEQERAIEQRHTTVSGIPLTGVAGLILFVPRRPVDVVVRHMFTDCLFQRRTGHTQEHDS